MPLITIETDAAGAAKLESAASGLSEVQFDIQQVQAQVGDPDTWMFLAQVASTVVPSLAAIIVAMIQNRQVRYLRVDDAEFRDLVGANQSEAIEALGQSSAK